MILIFTGHSRGGAIANLLGAQYEKKGNYKTYTYTFACPETTTASVEVETVFNIINGDDLIPTLPLSSWGFRRNGTDVVGSVNESCRVKWNRVNIYQKAYQSAQAQTVSYFAGICTERSLLYTIDADPKYTFTLEEEAIKMTLKDNGLWILSDGETTLREDAIQICPAFYLRFAGTLAGEASCGEYTKALAFYNKLKTGYSSVFSQSMDLVSDHLTGIQNSHSVLAYQLLTAVLEGPSTT